MTDVVRIVNCAEIAEDDWRFLEDQIRKPALKWKFYSCEPKNWIEKLIRKPKISRYRACFQAALYAKRLRADFMITHLPRATCWTAFFASLLNSNARHLAFSFNFTELPTGLIHKIMYRSFRKIDRFVVYSTAEKLLYAEYFGLDPERIDVLPWAMDVPQFAPSVPLIAGRYICATGGEGRDYSTLVKAMRVLPDIPLVLVARPHNLEGLDLPPNVRVFKNLPSQQFWNIVKFSKFTVIPLRDSQTNCGHISMVGAMKLEKPIITTESSGTADYVFHNVNAVISPPGNVQALAGNIKMLWSDPSLCQQLGDGATNLAKDKFQLTHWVDYLNKYLDLSGR